MTEAKISNIYRALHMVIEDILLRKRIDKMEAKKLGRKNTVEDLQSEIDDFASMEIILLKDWKGEDVK